MGASSSGSRFTSSGGSPTTPWLNSWNIQNEQKNTRRQSLSGQVDYKLAENTKLSFNGQWNYYDLLFTDRVITLTPGNASAALALAAPVTYGYGGTYIGQAGLGSAALQTINRSKSGVTWSSGASLTHDFGGGSKLEASTYWSQAYSKYRDVSRNWFSDATMTRTGLSPKLARHREEPLVEVHPGDAAALGLADRSLARVSTPR